jgi:hypothetical protein
MFTLAEIEQKEREIASRGYSRTDRVWLRAEALKQLKAAKESK